MRTKETAQTVAAATAATATTAALATLFAGGWLKAAEKLRIDATIDAPTAGALDVCLQRKLAADDWRDWIRFPQVAANGIKHFVATVTGEGASIVECGKSTDASPAMTIAVNTVVNVIPGDTVRIVCTTGAGTADAGAVSITITPFSDRN